MPAPLRILHCLDNLDVGGTETNAVRVLEHLDRARVTPHLLVLRPGGPLQSRVEAAQVPLQVVRVRSLASVGLGRAAWRLARWIRSERVAVLHAHDRYTNVLAALAARLAGVPVLTSKRWGESTRAHAILNRLAWRASTRVIANSAAVARDLAVHDGIPAARIATIPNFLDDADFAPPAAAEVAALRRSLGVDPDAIVIGIVANLRPVKDHATLVRAFARLAHASPALRLVLVGEGDARAALEAQVGALGLAGRVHLAGARLDGRRLHAAFDVTVLCSRSEGFPNSVIEAMAAARPVVGTRVGGIPDAVAAGESGLLVPVGDDEALALALGRLCADPGLRATLGARGQARARAAYSASAVVGDLMSLYEAVAGGAPARAP